MSKINVIEAELVPYSDKNAEKQACTFHTHDITATVNELSKKNWVVATRVVLNKKELFKLSSEEKAYAWECTFSQSQPRKIAKGMFTLITDPAPDADVIDIKTARRK